MKFSKMFLCLLLTYPFTALAEPDDLDTTFNGSGSLAFDATDGSVDPTDMIVQPDGKLLVLLFWNTTTVDTYRLYRLEQNGVFDSTFGTAGVVEVPFSSATRPCGLALQPDGKIIVRRMGAIDRYLANGAPDTGFSAPLSISSGCQDVLVKQNGKIMTVGWRTLIVGLAQKVQYVLAQLDGTTGAFDATFRDRGRSYVDISSGSRRAIIPNDETPHGAMLQTDEKIVILGGKRPADDSIDTRFVFLRVNQEGLLDTNFGQGGMIDGDHPDLIATLNESCESDSCYRDYFPTLQKFILEPDGNLLAWFNEHFYRFGNNGMPLNHFPNEVVGRYGWNRSQGPVSLPITDAAIHSDGRIVVLKDEPCFVNRLLMNGDRDGTFRVFDSDVLDNSGFDPLFHEFNTLQSLSLDYCPQMAWAPDGKIYVAGTNFGPPVQTIIARLVGGEIATSTNTASTVPGQGDMAGTPGGEGAAPAGTATGPSGNNPVDPINSTDPNASGGGGGGCSFIPPVGVGQ